MLQHFSTGHLQCYHSHGGINNAVAERSMWVTIQKLFSCRSAFPHLLFSVAHEDYTVVYLLLLVSVGHTEMIIASTSLFKRINNFGRQ